MSDARGDPIIGRIPPNEIFKHAAGIRGAEGLHVCARKLGKKCLGDRLYTSYTEGQTGQNSGTALSNTRTETWEKRANEAFT